MPVVNLATAVTLAAPVANLLTGSIYERPPFKARVRYFITGDAAGALRVKINHGARTIMEESPISRANRVPLTPDDFLTEAVIRPYEQIVVGARDTAAGPDTVFLRVELTPIR